MSPVPFTGFIMMTPQLFINYKLKSVAHLPWRMMSYKFLNTFIDDIFAFVIKMPTMYRIGCLRDGKYSTYEFFTWYLDVSVLHRIILPLDVVFFIFLYQRWIYKTDPTRINEFGYSAEMEKQKLKEKSAPQTAITDSSNTPTEEADTTPKTEEAKKED